MRPSWISIIAFCVALVALAGVITLAFAYENLRRQMAGISFDMARLPSISASHEHSEARLAVIRSQLSRVEKPIIVMGDSIVESALLPPALCGHPIINAGVGGATIGFFTRYASLIAGDSNPALILLSVGINDAGSPHNFSGFRSAYTATLQSLGSPVEVVTVTPLRNAAVDVSAVGQLNEVIANLNVPVIDASTGLTPDMTTDGIHLNQSGYAIWNKSVERGIKAKLGC